MNWPNLFFTHCIYLSMLSPERAIKMILPKRLPWVTEVVDVVHEGTVQSYRGSGFLTSPDEEWEEYVIGIVIDKELIEKIKSPSQFRVEKMIITNMDYLSNYTTRAKAIELNNVLYEINQLMTIKAKYAIEVFDSSEHLRM